MQSLTPKKIRFAILSSGPIVQKWKAEAIKQILADPNNELSLLIYNEGKAGQKNYELNPGNENSGNLLWSLYNRFWVQKN